MSKYIIDIPDNVKKIVYFHLGNANAVWTTSNDLDDLEQLNSDYINEHFGELQDTAYQKGLEEGKKQAKVQAHLDVCHDIERVAHGNYQKGLEDAWEAARKIFGYEIDGGIPIDEIGSVFGYSENATFCTADIFRHNTVSETIEKLKAYEEKQKADEKIKVGDEVEWDNDFTGGRFIVTRIFQPRNMKEQCDGIDDDGDVYRAVLIESLVKTGRHFDIESILEDMRND